MLRYPSPEVRRRNCDSDFCETSVIETGSNEPLWYQVFVPAFYENKKLDPKRTLAFYLRRTEQFRKLLNGKDETKLCLSLNAPHKPVSIQTISRWIVNTIKMANDDNIKVRGHSKRSIGPSWALFNGASMSAILNSADWKSESTFTKYYFKNVDIPVLK